VRHQGLGGKTSILLSQLGCQSDFARSGRGTITQTSEKLQGKAIELSHFDLVERLEEIPQWMHALAADCGPLHGLVHCAGKQLKMPMRTISRKQIDEIMAINFTSAMMLAKGFRQPGVVGATGSLVFISSVAGLVGEAAIAAYAASKGALIALVKSLAVEYARQGIRVNCVAPAVVQTEMTRQAQEYFTTETDGRTDRHAPLGLGTPRDVAYAIAFLLADTGRWITGTTLWSTGDIQLANPA